MIIETSQDTVVLFLELVRFYRAKYACEEAQLDYKARIEKSDFHDNPEAYLRERLVCND